MEMLVTIAVGNGATDWQLCLSTLLRAVLFALMIIPPCRLQT